MDHYHRTAVVVYGFRSLVPWSRALKQFSRCSPRAMEPITGICKRLDSGGGCRRCSARAGGLGRAALRACRRCTRRRGRRVSASASRASPQPALAAAGPACAGGGGGKTAACPSSYRRDVAAARAAGTSPLPTRALCRDHAMWRWQAHTAVVPIGAALHSSSASSSAATPAPRAATGMAARRALPPRHARPSAPRCLLPQPEHEHGAARAPHVRLTLWTAAWGGQQLRVLPVLAPGPGAVLPDCGTGGHFGVADYVCGRYQSVRLPWDTLTRVRRCYSLATWSLLATSHDCELVEK